MLTAQSYKSFRHLQEKRQIISPVKQRILSFVDFIGISKRKFYEATGISRGTLDNKSSINEDTLAKLIATYDQLNIEWLFTGKGEMLINELSIANEDAPSYGKLQDLQKKNKILWNIVENLQTDIEKYKNEIEELRVKLSKSMAK